MGYGRLESLVRTSRFSVCGELFTGLHSVSSARHQLTITAGQQTTFTASATPLHISTQTVTWSWHWWHRQHPRAQIRQSSVTLRREERRHAYVTLTTMARVLAPSPPIVVARFAPSPMLYWVSCCMFCRAFDFALCFALLAVLVPNRPGLAAAAELFALSPFSYAARRLLQPTVFPQRSPR